ncbi:flagellar hook-length control protein FliK [Sphingomonas sp.]
MMLSPLLSLRPDSPPAASPPGAQPPFAPEMSGFPDLSMVATLLSGAAAPPRQFPAQSGKNLPPVPIAGMEIALPESVALPGPALVTLPDSQETPPAMPGGETLSEPATIAAEPLPDGAIPAVNPIAGVAPSAATATEQTVTRAETPMAGRTKPNRTARSAPAVARTAAPVSATGEPDAAAASRNAPGLAPSAMAERPARNEAAPAIETPSLGDPVPVSPDARPSVAADGPPSAFTPPPLPATGRAALTALPAAPPPLTDSVSMPAIDTGRAVPVDALAPPVGVDSSPRRVETREPPPIAPPTPAAAVPAPPAPKPAMPVDTPFVAVPRPLDAAIAPPSLSKALSEPGRAADRAIMATSATMASVSGTAQALRTRPNTAFAPSLGEAAPPIGATPPIVAAAAALAASATVEAPTLAATPLDTRDPRWVETMIERIETLRDALGMRETRLRLTPDALGVVEVRIADTPDGVRVHLTADSAAARQLLAEAAPRLADMAEARGLKLAQDGAQPSPQHQQQSQSQSQSHDRGQPSRNRTAARPEHPLHPSGDDRIA